MDYRTDLTVSKILQKIKDTKLFMSGLPYPCLSVQEFSFYYRELAFYENILTNYICRIDATNTNGNSNYSQSFSQLSIRTSLSSKNNKKFGKTGCIRDNHNLRNLVLRRNFVAKITDAIIDIQ